MYWFCYVGAYTVMAFVFKKIIDDEMNYEDVYGNYYGYDKNSDSENDSDSD